ncbi:hypothetical protein GMPD_02910 [Geomonas paludis]|uniref:Uncharacterized protein n=1 Tax=Geomonas paludis TaxID=2740185 RepID=A0A6V8MR02_9BACT|nr:hypothetical protein GMPD_02910 [Geomonas paludis]
MAITSDDFDLVPKVRLGNAKPLRSSNFPPVQSWSFAPYGVPKLELGNQLQPSHPVSHPVSYPLSFNLPRTIYVPTPKFKNASTDEKNVTAAAKEQARQTLRVNCIACTV